MAVSKSGKESEKGRKAGEKESEKGGKKWAKVVEKVKLGAQANQKWSKVGGKAEKRPKHEFAQI